jgi:hypothetical protein
MLCLMYSVVTAFLGYHVTLGRRGKHSAVTQMAFFKKAGFPDFSEYTAFAFSTAFLSTSQMSHFVRYLHI